MKINSVIKFRSYNNYDLNNIVSDLKVTAQECNLQIKTIPIKQKNKRFTVLSSPHVFKKARDQFELTTHTNILHTTGSRDDTSTFLEILTNKQVKDIKYNIILEKTL